MELSYSQAINELTSIFTNLDKQTLKDAFAANNNHLNKTIDDLLRKQIEEANQRALEEEGEFPGYSELPKSRTKSNQYSKVEMQEDSSPGGTNGPQLASNKNGHEDREDRKRANSMYTGGMSMSWDFMSHEGFSLSSGGPHERPEKKYYNPEGEELPLGNRMRSGSFVQKIKEGITGIFRKGSKDLKEKGDYAEVNQEEPEVYTFENQEDVENTKKDVSEVTSTTNQQPLSEKVLSELFVNTMHVSDEKKPETKQSRKNRIENEGIENRSNGGYVNS